MPLLQSKVSKNGDNSAKSADLSTRMSEKCSTFAPYFTVCPHALPRTSVIY